MDWISVKDSLPETPANGSSSYSNDVLVTDCEHIWIDNYNKAGFWWDEGENVNVTHWMTLHEMPKI